MKQKVNFPRTHVSLHVSSIDQSVDFYSKFFNLAPSKVKEDYAKFELEKPAMTFSFVKKEGGVRAGFGHLGIQVETKEALNNWLNLARGHQLIQKEEAGTACCYAIQDKFWVSDPDGYEWEVYHFIEDEESENVSGDTVCCTPLEKEAATCC